MAKGNRGGKRAGGEPPELNKGLIAKANAAGMFIDYGNSTSRAYKKNINTINSLDLTSAEKKQAIKELHSLTENQLRAEAKSLSPYSMGVGPARFNQSKMRKNANSAVESRSKTINFVNNLIDKSNRNQTKKANERIFNAMSKAIKDKQLEFTVDGKTYYRKTTRGKSFYEK